ncbi:PDC sensor domain-containing protein [Microcystis aeruginosa]|nr:PDC sensor domain-containing protein [Microcystis aeruginosa]GCL48007.1 hypothetical protein NIES3787_37200 [Microcystis aeruginosa NIES-3787]
MVSPLYKFTAYFCLLSTLGFSAGAFTLYIREREEALKPNYHALERVANLKEQQVAQWFGQYKRDFTQDIQNIHIQQAALTLLTIRLKSDSDYQKAYRFLSNYFSHQKPSRESSLLLNQGGIVMFSTGKLEEGQYQPLQNTSTYFTLDQINVIKPIFYQSSLTQKPEITFVVPLLNSQNRRVGAFATVLNLQNLDNVVRAPFSNVSPEKLATSYLVGNLSRTQNALIAPDQRRSETSLPQISTPKWLGNSSLLIKNNYNVNSSGISEVLREKSGNLAYLDYRGEPVLGVYRWLSDYHLGLMVEIDQVLVFRQAQQKIRGLYWLGITLNIPLAVLLVTFFKPRPSSGIND